MAAKLGALSLAKGISIGVLLGYLAAASPGWAGPTEDAEAAYKNGDRTRAEWLRMAAESGDPNTQYNLGLMYANGRGVGQDYAEAAKWFRKAADQGHAAAQFNLGGLYANGQGVAQDDGEAAKWCRKAADQAHASAQFVLAGLYASGRGVPPDDAQAALWYRRAADHGYAPAQFQLGGLYAAGRGVPRDYLQAYKWWDIAAARFSPGAQRDETVRLRDGLANQMTAAQIADAIKLVGQWKRN